MEAAIAASAALAKNQDDHLVAELDPGAHKAHKGGIPRGVDLDVQQESAKDLSNLDPPNLDPLVLQMISSKEAGADSAINIKITQSLQDRPHFANSSRSDSVVKQSGTLRAMKGQAHDRLKKATSLLKKSMRAAQNIPIPWSKIVIALLVMSLIAITFFLIKTQENSSQTSLELGQATGGVEAIRELSMHRDRLVSEIQGMKSKHLALQKEILLLQDSLSRARRQFQDLEMKARDLTSIEQSLARNAEALTQREERLDGFLNQLVARETELDQQKTAFEQQKNAWVEQEKELKLRQGELSKQQKRLDELRVASESGSDELSAARQTIGRLRSEIKRFRDAETEKNLTITQLETQLALMQDKIDAQESTAPKAGPSTQSRQEVVSGGNDPIDEGSIYLNQLKREKKRFIFDEFMAKLAITANRNATQLAFAKAILDAVRAYGNDLVSPFPPGFMREQFFRSYPSLRKVDVFTDARSLIEAGLSGIEFDLIDPIDRTRMRDKIRDFINTQAQIGARPIALEGLLDPTMSDQEFEDKVARVTRNLEILYDDIETLSKIGP